MKKLVFNIDKTLKLFNVLSYEITSLDSLENINVSLEQMKSYIVSKKADLIGPMIQFTQTEVSENGELYPKVVIMLQCSQFITSVDQPYSMAEIIQIPHALYCKYAGPESLLKLAYDKIQVEAFENDIGLQDCSYTIFLQNDLEEDNIIADIFIPRK